MRSLHERLVACVPPTSLASLGATFAASLLATSVAMAGAQSQKAPPMKPSSPTPVMKQPSSPQRVVPAQPAPSKPRDVQPADARPKPQPNARPAQRPTSPGRSDDVQPTKPVRVPPSKPVDPAPSKPIEVAPKNPPRDRPADIKPQPKNPPVVRPSGKKPIEQPARGTDGDEKKPIVDPVQRDDDRGRLAPTVRPKNPPLVDPKVDPRDEPRDGRGGGSKPAPRPIGDDKPIAPKPVRATDRDQGGRFTSDTVHGVPVAKNPPKHDAGAGRHDDRGRGRSGGRAVVVDNRTYNSTHYNTYVTNVARCNGWWRGSRWSDCGPCHAWQSYDCNDGVRVSIGFGGGFNFGFFYGSSCAPLCSSWCNPWWDGYACSWQCRPGLYRWCDGWWWSGAYGCRPWPSAGWSPCYPYSPVVYAPVVYTPVVSAPPSPPNPDAMWAFLADGYDRDAEDGFILLEAAYPDDVRWEVGQAFARALRSDTMRAADLFRHAFAADPSAILRCSRDSRFITRIESLERSLAPLAAAANPSTDALVVTAASQAARGALQDAYLNATTAQSEGDRSAGTDAFVSWLRAELRARP